ncbi:ATP-dependent Lon protease pim1 [Quaeritorhiza haematococci]|nr:ATP-dependent Lon protease pim1 [Quaeritorhiza haematococci]
MENTPSSDALWSFLSGGSSRFPLSMENANNSGKRDSGVTDEAPDVVDHPQDSNKGNSGVNDKPNTEEGTVIDNDPSGGPSSSVSGGGEGGVGSGAGDAVDGGGASGEDGNGGGGKGRRGGTYRALDRGMGGANASEGSAPGGANSTSIERITVPKEYPQLLAVPLTRRPLFPGFYKSLYIKDPQVINAIQALLDARQPYIGIFLTKDDNSDSDVITDLSEVHKVGVFAQITNVYQAGPENSALTVVVYPHRRIRLTSLIPPPKPSEKSAPVEASSVEAEQKEVSEAVGESSTKEKEAVAESAEPVEEELEEDDEVLPVNRHLRRYQVGLVNVENMQEEPYTNTNTLIKATTSEILNVLKEISQINPLLRDQIITFSIQTGGNAFADASKLSDFVAAVSSGEPNELQEVLESLVIEERLHKSLVVLKKELANAKLQKEIAREVDKKMTRKQQEYFLMEQLKGIKKELGMDSDGKDKLVEKFKERAAQLKMPEAVKKVFEEELNKLQHLESAASEFNVTRNYLDWLTQIPWGKHSKENFDVTHAVSVLDEDHYGLRDVKDRILEFIAVGKLRGSVEGKIICLVGPPGVGKTSVGKSIARALGREFFRFSVGGLTDVAEIKGHRRTYVGAMPGKVIQALKKVQTENPLIMIDEIDKLGRGHQGDPASALLELLDPEQNNSFLDHYMDVPIDLSKVLFVCTANLTETIPAPLLDRMEIITLSGYVAEEKVAIASRYLAPAARAASGLENKKVSLGEDAIEHLIRHYCRESGVRNLKKHIDKVFRKAALMFVKSESIVSKNAAAASSSVDAKDAVIDGTVEPASSKPAAKADRKEMTLEEAKKIAESGLEITAANVKDFVGSPVFTTDRMYESTPAGVVMGLAWTSMGGSSIYIESVLESPLSEHSKPHLDRTTGQLGDVMKESATISYTFAKAMLARRFPENRFFEKASIHMHVPEGATPKDGPSAGCTMTTSLLSLALGTPIKPNVAMTGEITLTGKILKIGGVKEKTIAAKRSGVTQIIFPKANRSDWEELPEYIREGIQAEFVEWYDEIFDIVFEKYLAEQGKGEGRLEVVDEEGKVGKVGKK